MTRRLSPAILIVALWMVWADVGATATRRVTSRSEDANKNRPLQPVKAQLHLTEPELAAHWATLFQLDAKRVDLAIWELIHAPQESVPFLKNRLRPAAHADGKCVQRLLTALDSRDFKVFKVRSNAEAELEALGELVLKDLERELRQKNNTLEMNRRLQRLLPKARAAVAPFGPKRLGEWRALEVLERIGTVEAKQVLRELANGAPEAQLTAAARISLSRLKE